MGKNYWKNAYKDKWEDSSKREHYLIKYIESRTRLKVSEYGLGAGSDRFISGDAASNGHEKGDADLHVEGTGIYIEVTGPLTDFIKPDKPLWFRPDKLNNAVRNLRKGHDTFLAHHTPSADLWRIIHVDAEFTRRCFAHDFIVTEPVIRGRTERYVEIPADDVCIRPLEYLIQYLMNY